MYGMKAVPLWQALGVGVCPKYTLYKYRNQDVWSIITCKTKQNTNVIKLGMTTAILTLSI